MPLPNLPLRSFGTPSTPMRPSVSVGANRAQNFSVSKLNQKVEREQSAVSMSQVLARKAGQENSRSTSVAHIGQTMTPASTSITHAGVAADPADGQNDSGADDRRFDYMRRMIRERQTKQAEIARKEAASAHKGIEVGTGSSLRTTGTSSLHKQLGKEFKANKSTFGSVAGSEKKILEKTIAGRLSAKATGSSLNRHDRLAMKSDINKARDSGNVSIAHAKLLKKVVDKLN
jgi:hypothetical protein